MSGKWKPASAALAVCLCVVTLAGCASAPQLKGSIRDHLGKTEVIYVTPKDEIVVTDPAMTEAIHAFVVLRPGHAASPELAETIRESVRARLARHECPRKIEFVDALPLTTTGKIIRRLLRDQA